ncbi:hypothetical protein Btru_014176 [Bulinus truncatus]|nr:hypothetical protein Btru_014176 [Bulinus truncatus]
MDVGNSANGAKQIIYRRRLDRTPDKHFEKLPYDDKVTVGSLRKALEEAKFRIIKLRDENDEKDCIIDEEKSLRIAAEDKLQKVLVDLYNNPDVNLELQQRLPKAKKHKSHGPSYPLIVPEVDNCQQTDTSLNSRLNVSGGFSENLIHCADEDRSSGHDRDSIQAAPMANDSSQRFCSSSESLPSVSSHLTPGPPLNQTQGSVLSSSCSSMESSSYQALPSYKGAPSDHKDLKENVLQSNLPSGTASTEIPYRPQPSTSGIDGRTMHNSLNPVQIVSSQATVTSQFNPFITPNSHQSVNSSLINHQQSGGFEVITGSYPTTNQSGIPVVSAQGYSPFMRPTDSVMLNGSHFPDKLASLPTAEQNLTIFPSNIPNSMLFPSSAVTDPNNLSSVHAYNSPNVRNYFTAYASNPQSNGNRFSHPNYSVPVSNDNSLPFFPVNSSIYLSPVSSVPDYPAAATSPNQRSKFSESLQVSNMTRLLAEIAMLKKENNEMRDELNRLRQENEMLKKGAKSDKRDNFETVGALIEDIRATEKKHSDAVKLLVQAADDDKSAALKELEQIKLSNNLGLRKTLSESDISVADSYTSMRSAPKKKPSSKSSDSSQVSIDHLIRRQREIMKEEMQRVIDQRNEARQKLIKLEKKICNLEMAKSSESKNDKSLAKYKVIEEERDLLLSRFQFLIQDIGETKLLYNLHKALLSDEVTNDVNTFQSSKVSPSENYLANNKVKAELDKESGNLKTKLASLQKENLVQAECIEKLQQVVQRQRHKLNTLCAGPMLME